MEQVLERLKSMQTRKSTQNNYHGVWRNFNKFLFRLDYQRCSWEKHTSLFSAYLVDQGVQSSTLKSYFTVIKSVLKTDGYPWNDEKVLLNILTRSCRLQNNSVKTRLPIHKRLLEAILFEAERYFSTQPYLQIMYKMLFALAYYGLMRIGELSVSQCDTHTVRAENVHIGVNKNKLLIILYSSKTHGKESRPQKIKISEIHHSHSK